MRPHWDGPGSAYEGECLPDRLGDCVARRLGS
jgi:hypothetical protein